MFPFLISRLILLSLVVRGLIVGFWDAHDELAIGIAIRPAS